MVRIILWSLLAMVLLDITIDHIVTSPQNNVRPSRITQYFDYGRSIEAKLFRIVGSDDSNAASLARAGWFEPNPLEQTLKLGRTQGSKKNIYIYGMSFSNHIGEIISQYDESLNVMMFAGPGAPLSHSYTYYQKHRPHHQGDIVILGILASSLPRMNTLTHMTASFESPAAHFYPRYRLDVDNKLLEDSVKIDSLSELRRIMYDDVRWCGIKRKLEENDAFYDSTLFVYNLTDASIFARLLKRAWGQKHQLQVMQTYHDNNGFKNTDRLVDLSQLLVTKFATQVRDDGAIPFVILFNNRGFSDHLFDILKPVLDQNNIPYYSTHSDFPAEELSNFIPDGHFTPQIDYKIAMSVLSAVERIQKNF